MHQGNGMAAGVGGNAHTASMVRKQRDVTQGSASFLLLSPGPQPTARCCPHSGQVAPFQLNLPEVSMMLLSPVKLSSQPAHVHLTAEKTQAQGG